MSFLKMFLKIHFSLGSKVTSSIEELIDCVIHLKKQNLRRAFLLMFRRYVTPEQLLDHLIVRYALATFESKSVRTNGFYLFLLERFAF